VLVKTQDTNLVQELQVASTSLDLTAISTL